MRVFFLALIILCSTLYSCKEAQANQVNDVEVVTVDEMRENNYFKDTRVHVEPKDETKVLAAQPILCNKYLGKTVSEANKPKSLAVFCKDEERSPECSRILKEMGYEQVNSLEEGVSQWKLAEGELKEK